MENNIINNNFDIVIIGAGLSGATLAERYANKLNKKVLIIEKRDHIGGNCFDKIDENGLLVSKYGAHTFHTNNEKVWEYVNQFSSWQPFTYKVVSKVDRKLVPIPVNINTINQIFGLNLQNELEAKNWLEKNTEKIINPKNSEESAISRVGKVLYEKLFKNYTIKQWDTDPSKLDPSVLNRIPIHTSFDDRYFTDKYQVVPVGGYTKFIEKMISNPNIKIVLNTEFDYFKNNNLKFEKLFFTGPIDRFFENKFEKLQYRSLRFEFETHEKEWYQQYPAVHYPNEEKFTRIIEYKHFTGQKNNKTVISKEYPTWEGEPYYPVPTKHNQEIYERYRTEALALEKKNIYFVGRLANYKYFNMDEAIKNALELFEQIENIKQI